MRKFNTGQTQALGGTIIQDTLYYKTSEYERSGKNLFF